MILKNSHYPRSHHGYRYVVLPGNSVLLMVVGSIHIVDFHRLVRWWQSLGASFRLPFAKAKRVLPLVQSLQHQNQQLHFESRFCCRRCECSRRYRLLAKETLVIRRAASRHYFQISRFLVFLSDMKVASMWKHSET